MQVIFQDPYGSLNPRMTVGDIIGEPLVTNERRRRATCTKRVAQLLDLVGLPARSADRYPARVLRAASASASASPARCAVDPSSSCCDEPVSALDVSIQAQIINLLVRPAGASSASPISSSPTTSRSSRHI